MSEEEIYKNDLNTIYRIIEIHSEMNGGKKHDKKAGKKQPISEQQEAFIDSIKF